MADYLAIIPIGGGSSWGRAADKEVAIQNAIKSLKDWDSLFEVANIDITINVVDVDGYNDCDWMSPFGLRGTNVKTGHHERIERPVEYVNRQTPKWHRRKK